MKRFEVRVKYKGRLYGSTEWVRADSMTLDDDTYQFWLHNVESRDLTASFPVAAVESVQESGSPVSDEAVIRRIVEVVIVYVVEKAKADGAPLSEKQQESVRREWTTKFKEWFATASAGSKAVQNFLAAANQMAKLLD